jgi:hypothetical protein
VIVSYDPGDFVDSLAATGVPVLVLTDAVVLEDVLEQLRILGAVTGNVDQAASVVADLETRLEAAFAAGPDPARQITFFHELDATLYSVTSETFIGDVYRRFGLENIADAASPDGAGARYPQLSSEFLLAADPGPGVPVRCRSTLRGRDDLRRAPPGSPACPRSPMARSSNSMTTSRPAGDRASSTSSSRSRGRSRPSLRRRWSCDDHAGRGGPSGDGR